MRGHPQPTFYFSFRSPYSWLAARRLGELGVHPGGDVRFIPFWEPDGVWQAMLQDRGHHFLYVPMSRQKHLYIVTDVSRIAARFGLRVTWPVDRDPDWSVPHLCYLVAERLGRAADFLGQVYEARWGRGRDIWSWAVMEEIAARLGLLPGEFTDRARSEETARDGLDALEAAVQDGVFGVPFFLHGREKFWGIDRLDQFLVRLATGTDAITREVAPELSPAPGALLSNCVADHAGGCG